VSCAFCGREDCAGKCASEPKTGTRVKPQRAPADTLPDDEDDPDDFLLDDDGAEETLAKTARD
jgi:hypothetical protein